MAGATDPHACTTRRGQNCRCGPCAVCGYGPHMAIHGPAGGQPPGSKPYGHEYQPVVPTVPPPAPKRRKE